MSEDRKQWIEVPGSEGVAVETEDKRQTTLSKAYDDLHAKFTTLKAENARLRVQVEGMREIVSAVAKGEPEHGGKFPDGEIYGCIRVSPLELKEQAQSLLTSPPDPEFVVVRRSAVIRALTAVTHCHDSGYLEDMVTWGEAEKELKERLGEKP